MIKHILIIGTVTCCIVGGAVTGIVGGAMGISIVAGCLHWVADQPTNHQSFH